MQFQVPNSATVNVRKSLRTVEGIDQWPMVSIEKIFQYGLQQLSNDAVASAENDEEIEALFQKRIDNLSKGVLRASPVRVSDPVEREAMRIARERVLAAFKVKGISPKGQKIADLAAALLSKNPDIREVAKANVELANALDIEVDLPEDIGDADEPEVEDEEEEGADE